MTFQAPSSFFESSRVKSAPASGSYKLNFPLVIGICENKDQEAKLIAHGIDPLRIWMIGRADETIDWALSFFRQAGGIVKVATDLRIFGRTRKALMEMLTRLEALGLQVVDIFHAEDHSFTQRVTRALQAIACQRFEGNHRKARKVGRMGGLAKGASEWDKRAEIAPRWLIDNLIRICGVNEAARILDNKISASTLRRKYLSSLQPT